MKFAQSLLSACSLITLTLVSVAASAATQQPADPSIKEYLKGKGATYMVRFYEKTENQSSKQTTVECHEGLLERDVVQHELPEYASMGMMSFKHGQLTATVRASSEIYLKGKRQGSITMNAFFDPPNYSQTGVAHGIGGWSDYNLRSDLMNQFGGYVEILENGTGYQDLQEPRKVKQLGVQMQINHLPEYGCAFHLAKGRN